MPPHHGGVGGAAVPTPLLKRAFLLRRLLRHAKVPCALGKPPGHASSGLEMQTRIYRPLPRGGVCACWDSRGMPDLGAAAVRTRK